MTHQEVQPIKTVKIRVQLTLHNRIDFRTGGMLEEHNHSFSNTVEDSHNAPARERVLGGLGCARLAYRSMV